jgi:hypothetical protein
MIPSLFRSMTDFHQIEAIAECTIRPCWQGPGRDKRSMEQQNDQLADTILDVCHCHGFVGIVVANRDGCVRQTLSEMYFRAAVTTASLRSASPGPPRWSGLLERCCYNANCLDSAGRSFCVQLKRGPNIPIERIFLSSNIPSAQVDCGFIKIFR